MRLNQILNKERVQALNVEQNAYINYKSQQNKTNQSQNPTVQNISKVIFPEPYENLNTHYSKSDFCLPLKEEPKPNPPCKHQNNSPMFDIKSLLPMLLSGKFNDILKPLMGMFGNGGGSSGGGLGDVAKIFELFKPKSKPKKEEKKEEDVSSKFDDMIIIED